MAINKINMELLKQIAFTYKKPCLYAKSDVIFKNPGWLVDSGNGDGPPMWGHFHATILRRPGNEWCLQGYKSLWRSEVSSHCTKGNGLMHDYPDQWITASDWNRYIHSMLTISWNSDYELSLISQLHSSLSGAGKGIGMVLHTRMSEYSPVILNNVWKAGFVLQLTYG